MPHLGERGTVIWLVSGTVIVWDGRAIKHCTAMPVDGAGDGNALYGFFMAVGKPQRGK